MKDRWIYEWRKNDKTIHISDKTPGKKSSMPSDACLIELIGKQENKKYNLFIQDIINKKDYEFSIGRGPNINDIVIDDFKNKNDTSGHSSAGR